MIPKFQKAEKARFSRFVPNPELASDEFSAISSLLARTLTGTCFFRG
jgi:hypothetical protein